MTPSQKEPLKIKKRDGRIVNFDKAKISVAILKAADSVGLADENMSQKLAARVGSIAADKFGAAGTPSVEQIQEIVEIVLIDSGQAKIAKAYILYRQKHAQLRSAKKAILGREVAGRAKISVNSARVLKERYLRQDDAGRIIETPDGLFWRVANNVAQGDAKYGANAQDVEKTAQSFYEIMADMDYMPNSPTLMNAGNDIQQLSACFVIPIEDSLAGIFDSIKHAALIHQSGGGTGFGFSKVRPKNSMVSSTKGVASGPISFMRIFNAATDVIKQGGKRRGANMAILRVDHPDILDFITAKENLTEMTNFNISVAVTEKFMQAVEKDEDYPLVNPHDGEIVNWLPARDVYDLIITCAWKNGDPGIVFIDRINRDNPTPLLGEMESTNPCGEQPLLPYEACNLGSINLDQFVTKDLEIDWDRLRKVTHTAIHFLDNVVTMNRYPLPQITKIATENRRIGLGVMGFADLLLHIGIPYNTEKARKLGEKIMKFINLEAKEASINLAKTRGTFKNWKGSIYDVPGGPKMRNCTVTTIAPTGTISMIADCSSGIEPIFAVSFIKKVMDGQELVYVNSYFEKVAKEKGFYSEELMRKVAEEGTIQTIDEIPADVKKLFVTAQDIAPADHLKMQAAFQRHVDNAVSKTINFAHEADVESVRETYDLAYKHGLKGVTIFRDGSRDQQVLQTKKTKKLLSKVQITQTTSELKDEILNGNSRKNNKKTVGATAQQEIPLNIETGLLKDWFEHQRESFVNKRAAKTKSNIKAELKAKVKVAATGAELKENKNYKGTESTVCPECSGKMAIQEGCALCNSCGFSYCTN